MDDKQKAQIEEVIKKVLPTYLSGNAFTARKVTDTPTDSLQVVNRGYVTLNGVTGNRPTSSVTGQFFFDTSLGKPVWWNGSTWVLATGIEA